VEARRAESAQTSHALKAEAEDVRRESKQEDAKVGRCVERREGMPWLLATDTFFSLRFAKIMKKCACWA